MARKVSPDKLWDKIGLDFHEKQEEAFNLYLEKNELVLSWGRRGGKSNFGAAISLYELLKDNKKIWIVGPSYTTAGKIFEYIDKWVKQYFPSMAKGIYQHPNPGIKTPWGSSLECKSTSSESSLIGDQLDLVIIDEAARVNKRVRDRDILPNLIDRQGKLVQISTPFGKNWFYEQFLRCKDMKNAAARQYPTHVNIGNLPNLEEWIKNYRQSVPDEMYKQEILAEFLDDGAVLFRNLRDIIVPSDDILRQEGEPGKHYVMGVDLGKVNDPTVITVIDEHNHEMVYFERFKGEEFPFQRKKIASIARKFNNARCLIDSTGVGNSVLDELNRDGVSVHGYNFTYNSKSELIEKLRIFIEEKALTLPNEPDLVEELENYGIITHSKQTNEPLAKPKYGPWVGNKDDCVDSLALAVWQLYQSQRMGVKKKKSRTIGDRDKYFQEKSRPIKRFNYY